MTTPLLFLFLAVTCPAGEPLSPSTRQVIRWPAWTAPRDRQVWHQTVEQVIGRSLEPRTLVELGRLEILSGRASRAVSLLDEAIRSGGRSDKALELLARAYRARALDEGDDPATPWQVVDLGLQDAAAVWHELAERHPTGSRYRLAEGSCHLDRGDLDRAETLARQILETDRNNAKALLLVGRCKLAEYARRRAEGRSIESLRELFDESDSLLSRARVADPGLGDAFVALGDLRAWADQNAEAIPYWRDALLLDPSSEDVHAALFDALTDNEEDEHRLTDLLHEVVDATLARPTTPRQRAVALMWLGRSLLRLRSFQEAAEVFNRAAIEWPAGSDRALLFTALAYHSSNDYDLAAEILGRIIARERGALARAVAGEPQPEEIIASLRFHVDRLIKKEHLPEARDLQREIVRLRPNDASHVNNLAYLCRETNLAEESYQVYRKALELSPNDARLLNDTGVVLQHYLRRDLDEARRLYQRAIEEAGRVLADPAANPAQRDAARSALNDARENLRALDRGSKPRAGGKKKNSGSGFSALHLPVGPGAASQSSTDPPGRTARVRQTRAGSLRQITRPRLTTRVTGSQPTL